MIIGKTANEIFDSVRLHVQSGELQPGDTLPPVRELAVSLAINRNTVAAAYKRLVTSGLAQSLGRNGTVIAAPNFQPAREGNAPQTRLIDISGGNPAPDRLPDVRRYVSAIDATPRLYGDAAINARLSAWAANWMADDHPADGEINLASGAVDAVERLLCAHLLPGDSVAVEDPCFLSSINMLRYAGFSPAPVAVDHDGMRANALESALQNGARAVIITPRAHNPTGCSLSAARAAALCEVLSRYPQVMVIVDDHFALLSAADWHPVIPDTTRRWALVRSLSKALGPDLRMAMIACDTTTSAHLRLRLNPGSQWVSHLLQDLAFACLIDDHFQEMLEENRRFYASQQRKMATALHECGVHHVLAGDGLNLWLPLTGPSQPVAFLLAQAGWLVREGEPFGLQTPSHGLRLSLSTLNDDDIARLAGDIQYALQQHNQEAY